MDFGTWVIVKFVDIPVLEDDWPARIDYRSYKVDSSLCSGTGGELL